MSAETEDEPRTTTVSLRVPGPEDGQAMWRLAGACPPLEVNTSYAYILLCTHFSDTCVIAEAAGEAVGYVAGYCPPKSPDTLFIWQIGVAEAGRGKGLGVAMLKELVCRAACRDVSYIDTTITPSNTASRRLFEGIARKLGAAHEVHPFMDATFFPGDTHEPEDLIRIGPLPRHGGLDDSTRKEEKNA